MSNKSMIKTGSPTLRHVLSVRCPMCRAKAKQPCTLTTGHPSAKTHVARQVAATKVAVPESSGLSFLRGLKAATGRGFRFLFEPKHA